MWKGDSFYMGKVKVKIKQSHYKPGQAQRFQEVEAPRYQDSWHAPATFIPRKYSWYSFLLEAESTPGP
jgi:hypothetical protein